MTIVMWATGQGGEGYSEAVGSFDELEDIRIRIGMFDKDVVLTFAREAPEDTS